MAWIFRMLLRGLALLLATMVLRACDKPTYNLDALRAAPLEVADGMRIGSAA